MDADFVADDGCDNDYHDQSQYPQQRNAANARERARMRVLSRAFCRLKTTLPWVPPDTKLSKLDTLRLATSYIAHLRTILKLSDNDAPDPSTQPVSTTWPFNFHSHWEIKTGKEFSIQAIRNNDWDAYAEFCQHSDKEYCSRGDCKIKYANSESPQCVTSTKIAKIRRRTTSDCNFHQFLPASNNDTEYHQNHHYKNYICYDPY